MRSFMGVSTVIRALGRPCKSVGLQPRVALRPCLSRAAPLCTTSAAQLGLLSAVANVVVRALGVVGRAIASSESEDARLGRYLHYNINYRATRSASLRFQCGHGLILGAPLQISTPLTDADKAKAQATQGSLSASESAAVVSAVRGIPLEAAFPVLRGASGRGRRSQSDDQDVCGILYIRAIARQADARGADAASGTGPQSPRPDSPLLPKGRTHGPVLKASASGGSTSKTEADQPVPCSGRAASPSSSEVTAVAAVASGIDLTGGLPALQPLKGSIAGVPLTLAVRSRRVLQAVAGRQQLFVEASDAAAAAARDARLEARMAARDALTASRNAHSSKGSNAGAATAADDAARSVTGGGAAAAARAPPSSLLANSTLTGAGDASLAASLAQDLAPVLGSAAMFVAEQLQDTSDEARYRGLAPAVAFDVHEAVFVPSTSAGSTAAGAERGAAGPAAARDGGLRRASAAPARMDVTRELRGIVFDDLGALADGAASVITQKPDGVDGIPDSTLVAAAAAVSGAGASSVAALAAPSGAGAAASGEAAGAPPGAPIAGAAVSPAAVGNASASLPVADVTALPEFKL